jgi:hypothetical protein
MQTNNISKEIQQIQNNIGIIISYFFIRQNQTLVPKIDPDYVNNQINNLSDKISKININYHHAVSNNNSSFSPQHIEFLNKSISQIHLHDLSETTTSKYIDDKRIKEIELMIQKQKGQIKELGGLLQKYANTPNITQPIQANTQSIIKKFIIPDNEISKLNAQIKAIDDKMSVFKNDINQYILDKKNSVNKALKLFSGEYNQLLQMINSINRILTNRINSLATVINTLNNQTNAKIDSINLSLTKKTEETNKNLNFKINSINLKLTSTINQKEADLINSINTVNSTLTQKEASLNTYIDNVNSALTQSINQKNAILTQNINTVNSALTQKEASLNISINTVNSALTQKEDSLIKSINTVNSVLTQTINQKESTLNTLIDTINTGLTQTINKKEADLNTELQQLSNHINTNFDVLYENSNQNSNRIVYFNKVKVNEIEFSSFSNISDITSLSTALGNLTTNFNLIYQNTNVNSDKTAYFNKVVAQNIECNNFTGVSDERLKKNIVDLKNVGADLQKLRTVGFDWKSNNEADIGFIAQDVEKIFPSLVKTDENGFKSVKYLNFVPILVQGYKEQADEIRKLKKILIIGLVMIFFFLIYKCI